MASRSLKATGSSAKKQEPTHCYRATQNEKSSSAFSLRFKNHLLTDLSLDHVVNLIFRQLATQVDSHLFFHAGAVALRNKGILLLGDSMHGKTTLVLELVRRGYQFLSDDISPLGIQDCRIYQNPRSLVVRDGSLEMSGFGHLKHQTAPWLNKRIVNPKKLRSDCLSEPVPIRHIFLVNEHSENSSSQPGRWSSLVLSSLNEDLRCKIQALPQVLEVKEARESAIPHLRVLSSQPKTMLNQVDLLCKEHGIFLLTGEIWNGKPDFTGPVRLQEIDRQKTFRAMLNNFFPGPDAEAFQRRYNASPARLSLGLASIIKDATYHSLTVGPLHDMAEAIHSVAGDNHS